MNDSTDKSMFPPSFIYLERVEDVANSIKKLTFPDGFSCYVQLGPNEAALIYNEVIVKQEYFQHGLSVANARCVIDVGANIGIFTMAVKRKTPRAVIYAFEPIQDTFQILEKNVHSTGCSDIHLYNVAIGSQDHTEKVFTFFPNMPGNSTARPALKDNQKQAMAQLLGKATSDFLHQSETRTVQVRTLSSIIRDQEITNVDFLKIDVEGSEISVLEGIEEAHWSIFRQVAIEAHSAALQEQACEILVQHGFEVSSDLGLSARMGDSIVYGRRS